MDYWNICGVQFGIQDINWIGITADAVFLDFGFFFSSKLVTLPSLALYCIFKWVFRTWQTKSCYLKLLQDTALPVYRDLGKDQTCLLFRQLSAFSLAHSLYMLFTFPNLNIKSDIWKTCLNSLALYLSQKNLVSTKNSQFEELLSFLKL